ncbi:MAG: MATE family efflux transporter [Lachnospiraceae bacterium]|jgi:MATE efflux family protein|nr:MATE family efflux transporter [Lachnospiraceae bacterium]MBF0997669.1 MATE family efflux transporter [Lachnospiraceae bacterium]MBF1004261.1 MATE family efflux transporter [Lachnospiraceae bacterium]
MKNDRNMTQGSPYKLIGGFASSLFLGNLFQQLYLFVDSIIVGRKIGPLGLSAIGGTDWLIFLVQGFVIGLIQGFSILLGNAFGEKNERKFATYYKKARTLCIWLSLILVIILFFFTKYLLRLIGTKQEVFDYAYTYVFTIFMGVPLLIFYQLFSSALRSRGNANIPVLIMAVSSISNIILDILFLYVLNIGILGAALGTVLSQFLSMVLCGYFFLTGYKIEIHTANDDKHGIFAKLLCMGFPTAMQSAVTSIGGLMVLSKINSFDISFLTAYTVAIKVYSLLEIGASSLGIAVSTYVSQNYGGNKKSRVREGVRAGLIIGFFVSMMCSLLMYFGGEQIIRLFIDDTRITAEITTYAYNFMRILSYYFYLLFVLYILRASLQGMKVASTPLISSFLQLVMRLLCAYVLTIFIGSRGIFFGEIFAWLFADMLLIFSYIYSIRKMPVEYSGVAEPPIPLK